MSPCERHRMNALLALYEGAPMGDHRCAECDAFVADAARIRDLAGLPLPRRARPWFAGIAAAALLVGAFFVESTPVPTVEAPQPAAAATPPPWIAAPLMEATVRVRASAPSWDAVIDADIRSVRSRLDAVSMNLDNFGM